MAPQKIDGFNSIARAQDRISSHRQELAGKFADIVLVFDDEDRFVSSCNFRWFVFGIATRGAFRCFRQIDFKRSALARSAFDPNKAAALFYDAIDSCQAEPSAFANFLCGEERL